MIREDRLLGPFTLICTFNYSKCIFASLFIKIMTILRQVSHHCKINGDRWRLCSSLCPWHLVQCLSRCLYTLNGLTNILIFVWTSKPNWKFKPTRPKSGQTNIRPKCNYLKQTLTNNIYHGCSTKRHTFSQAYLFIYLFNLTTANHQPK